uniref:Uncharacterized protein n=1 Tax=Knipowitschia caucasica TaxID=637954 RepID=A0AAV2J0I2_KNICA
MEKMRFITERCLMECGSTAESLINVVTSVSMVPLDACYFLWCPAVANSCDCCTLPPTGRSTALRPYGSTPRWNIRASVPPVARFSIRTRPSPSSTGISQRLWPHAVGIHYQCIRSYTWEA